jgi:hypothetical protein
MNESAAVVAFFSCASRTRSLAFRCTFMHTYNILERVSEREHTYKQVYRQRERAERRKKKSFSTKVRGCAPARDFPCHAMPCIASAKEYSECESQQAVARSLSTLATLRTTTIITLCESSLILFILTVVVLCAAPGKRMRAHFLT